MSKTAVSTALAPGPTNGAPYSQAIRAGGFVFVSGQLPLDAKTGQTVGTTIAEQTCQVMRNLQHILEEAGSSLGDLVKTTVYLLTREEWPEMNEAYRSFVESPAPARVAVVVAELPFEARIELDAIAQV
jgi:2-iminobutanoate/2-iminopropanoate deaminase